MTTSLRALALALVLASCAGMRGSLFQANQPVVCSGGAEVVAGGCFCASGMTWNGLACQGKPNPENCTGGSYPFGPAGQVECRCLTGHALNNGVCTQLHCTGGSVPGDSECVCPEGSAWDGSQCISPQPLTCSGGAVILDGECMCINGTMWDGNSCIVPASAPGIVCTGGAFPSGDQCFCPENTTWDGTNCIDNQVTAAPEAQPAARRRSCRAALADKGFGPDTFHACDGVNHRCALALLDHGFGPAELHVCRGVEGACAEELLNTGFGPAQMSSCARKGHGSGHR